MRKTGAAAGEAITFFMEEDAGQLRSIANVMRAAGCDVPAWMLELKKERRHRKRPAAPAAGGISTEPKAERQKGGKGGGGATTGSGVAGPTCGGGRGTSTGPAGISEGIVSSPPPASHSWGGSSSRMISFTKGRLICWLLSWA